MKPFILRFPQVCSSFTNPKVSKIYVSPGCIVERNSDLIEIESEKGIFLIQSEFSGVVTDILVREYDSIKENDELLKIIRD